MDVKDGTVENHGAVKVMLSRSKIPPNLPLQRETCFSRVGETDCVNEIRWFDPFCHFERSEKSKIPHFVRDDNMTL